jgi:hypothetical protein
MATIVASSSSSSSSSSSTSSRPDSWLEKPALELVNSVARRSFRLRREPRNGAEEEEEVNVELRCCERADYYATNVKLTGLAVWFGATNLAQWAAAGSNVECFRHRRVLELGCGLGFAGISVAKMVQQTTVASVVARADDVAPPLNTTFVLTDGEIDLLPLLNANCSLNGLRGGEEEGKGAAVSSSSAEPSSSSSSSSSTLSPSVSVECRRLWWGAEEEDLATLLAAHPGGFEVIMGADLVYAAGQLDDTVPLLFQTVAALLANKPTTTTTTTTTTTMTTTLEEKEASTTREGGASSSSSSSSSSSCCCTSAATPNDTAPAPAPAPPAPVVSRFFLAVTRRNFDAAAVLEEAARHGLVIDTDHGAGGGGGSADASLGNDDEDLDDGRFDCSGGGGGSSDDGDDDDDSDFNGGSSNGGVLAGSVYDIFGNSIDEASAFWRDAIFVFRWRRPGEPHQTAPDIAGGGNDDPDGDHVGGGGGLFD